jgi:prepilin-type N-terminal cleavage/methylation domain-containing protein
MQGVTGRKSNNGLTLIEVIVVVAILVIIIAIGTINYTEQIKLKRYMTSVDKLMSMLERANSEGKAFGLPAENYFASGSSGTIEAGRNYTYRVSVITRGTEKSDKSEILENVNITFNFDLPPMNQSQVENFRGVLLVIAYQNDAGNFVDQVAIPISTYGAPHKPGAVDPVSDALRDNRNDKYEITISYKEPDGKDIRKDVIRIDKYLGTIDRVKVL